MRDKSSLPQWSNPDDSYGTSSICGYLNKILNAKVYDVAIETELQHAKNLSKVRLEWVWVCNLMARQRFDFK